jgi:hypothetical protein
MSNLDDAAKSSLSFALIIPVVLAGVVGTIANAVAAAIVVSPASIRLALVPGRYTVAIVVAASLPFILSLVRQPISPMLGLVVLTVIPSLLAKLVFSARATWSIVLLLNAVYALVTLAVYAFVAGRMRRS